MPLNNRLICSSHTLYGHAIPPRMCSLEIFYFLPPSLALAFSSISTPSPLPSYGAISERPPPQPPGGFPPDLFLPFPPPSQGPKVMFSNSGFFHGSTYL